jgi:UDPglucose 6-dehydrogenase
MKIGIIGIGKLGLCFGLNLEKVGHEVYGVDKSEDYIKKLKSGIFSSSEPGVNEALLKSSKFNFSTSLSSLANCNIIFIVVATPSTSDFKYDHSAIDEVITEIKSMGISKERKDLVINCTTFPGYCDSISDDMKSLNYYVSYNPEFIAQGTIMRDQVYCDNVLIGAPDKIASTKITDIYQSFVKSDPVYNIMSCTEAELTKLSVNCFLTTKISYANMIGDIALRYNCNPDVVLGAIGTDSRIGKKYLGYGFGFGGPCFPRDNRALAKCASEVGISAEVSIATDKMNDLHLNYQLEKFIKDNPDKNNPITFEYLTYKRESVLLEESQQLKFALKLKELGYKIKVLDNRDEVLHQLKIMNI